MFKKVKFFTFLSFKNFGIRNLLSYFTRVAQSAHMQYNSQLRPKLKFFCFYSMQVCAFVDFDLSVPMCLHSKLILTDILVNWSHATIGFDSRQPGEWCIVAFP